MEAQLAALQRDDLDATVLALSSECWIIGKANGSTALRLRLLEQMLQPPCEVYPEQALPR